MQPRYGDEQTGTPPSKLYNRRKAQMAVNHSYILAKELANIHRKLLLQQSNMYIGILSGFFSRSRNENRCDKAPYAEEFNFLKWRRFLSKISNIKPRLIAVSEINNSFCCIVNPFGESYPEKTSAPNTFPAYELIREYIFLGGVFVTCGGLPFTYYFDVITGNQENVSTVVQNITVGFRLITIQGRPQIQLLGTTVLVNNFIQRDFNIMTVMDDPISGNVGPFPSRIYQEPQDKQFWECQKEGDTLNLFRPINPAVSPDTIPVLRAQRLRQENFPVAFIRYGFGILLHIGLDLSTGRNEECALTKEVMRGLLQNYQNYF